MVLQSTQILQILRGGEFFASSTGKTWGSSTDNGLTINTYKSFPAIGYQYYWEYTDYADGIFGDLVWSDGVNYYYSAGKPYDWSLPKFPQPDQLKFNKTFTQNNCWEPMTWNVDTGVDLREIGGNNIWQDQHGFIYFSEGTLQYYLDRSTNTWKLNPNDYWSELKVYGQYVWNTKTYIDQNEFDTYYTYPGKATYRLTRNNNWEKSSDTKENFNGMQVFKTSYQVLCNGYYLVNGEWVRYEQQELPPGYIRWDNIDASNVWYLGSDTYYTVDATHTYKWDNAVGGFEALNFEPVVFPYEGWENEHRWRISGNLIWSDGVNVFANAQLGSSFILKTRPIYE